MCIHICGYVEYICDHIPTLHAYNPYILANVNPLHTELQIHAYITYFTLFNLYLHTYITHVDTY